MHANIVERLPKKREIPTTNGLFRLVRVFNFMDVLMSDVMYAGLRKATIYICWCVALGCCNIRLIRVDSITLNANALQT